MISKTLDKIEEGDILAKDVVLDGTVLIPTGTPIKRDYISNLKELNIELIYVEYTGDNPLKDVISRKLFDESHRIMLHHIENLRHDNIEILKELLPVAESILDEVYDKFDPAEKVEIPERSPDLPTHIIYSCAYACMIGKCMGRSKESMRDLAAGMILHDIGYRYIATEYADINPEDLNPGEVFELKKHTIYAFSALDSVDWLTSEAKMVILSHHERIDGTGYPLKQKKLNEDIRIACVSDEFDALISGNGCKICTPKVALETMRSRESGFDGRMLDEFVKHLDIE